MKSFEEKERKLEELLDETSAMIYNLGIRLFKNHEDAMDFSQDVYVKAIHKKELFQEKSKFSTWLYSLALNLGLNKIKKNKKIQFVDNTDEYPWDVISAETIDSNDPYFLFSKNEKSEIIQKEVDSLPEQYRIPLILFYYENMSYTDIAKNLKIKIGTIKSNIYRGKLILKNKLIGKVKLE